MLSRRVAAARDSAWAETYHRLAPLLEPPRPTALDGLLDVDTDLAGTAVRSPTDFRHFTAYAGLQAGTPGMGQAGGSVEALTSSAGSSACHPWSIGSIRAVAESGSAV